MHGMKNMQDGGPATMADATGYANGGMTEPQAINTVGSPLAPRDNSGRQKYAIQLLGIPAGIAALRAARPLAAAGRGIKNFYQGFKGARTFSPGNLGFGGRLKDLAFGQGRFRQPATPKGYDAGFRKGQAPAPLSFKEIISNPTTLGRAAREYPLTALGSLTLPNMAINAVPGLFGAAKGAGKMFIDAVVPGEQFKEKPELKEDLNVEPGQRGSLLPKSEERKVLSEVEKEEKQEQRLNKVYKALGVDRAQKNAASKALIDVSQYIDEGGKDTISKKNIGSTINKAIASFDKRLDKVDQLKEAAGLMMVKADLANEGNTLDKEYKKLKVTQMQKELNPTFAATKATYARHLTGDNLIASAANAVFGEAFGGSILSTKDFNQAMKNVEGQAMEGDTILQIATNTIKQIELRDKKPVPEGYYAVGDKVVLINSNGEAEKIVG